VEPLVLIVAFAAGLLFRRAGYPPLLGYLLAGFVAHAYGIGDFDSLTPLADAGILLLLFTIGLKLNFSALTPRYVWGSALLHMIIVVPLTAAVILMVGLYYAPLSFDNPSAAWTLAFALSFSSTVFAIKMFEERGELASFYASIAIGILVVQDVLAVLYLVLASGQYPSPWALLLLALPLLKLPLMSLLRIVGHGELLLFLGITLAFSFGSLFEYLDLKAGLGALLAGMLVSTANWDKAKELNERLFALKNLLLIGFVVQIGYFGIPSLSMVIVAAILAMLVFLRPIIYFSLSTLFGLRARTGVLIGASLFNYSEFGLIVAAYAVKEGLLETEWVTTLALAMAISFVIATPLNNHVHRLYRRYQSRFTRYEHESRLPEEAVATLGSASVVVLGMGRVGRGAYAALEAAGHDDVVGIEENRTIRKRLLEEGYRCIQGDATDRDFWERTRLAERQILLISLSNRHENLAVVELARDMGCKNTLAVATRYPDEKEMYQKYGCVAYYLYEDVGRDFALHVLNKNQ